MKRFTIFAGFLLLALSQISCDKDGTPVELEGQEERRILVTDYKALGQKYGEQFGNGIKEIKDTVAVACSFADKGFALDSLTFSKKLTPAFANCQFPYEKYLAAAKTDSTFKDWESGFLEGYIQKANISMTAASAILQKYKEVDMENVSNLQNIQKAFDIAIQMGGRQAKLEKQKIL